MPMPYGRWCSNTKITTIETKVIISKKTKKTDRNKTHQTHKSGEWTTIKANGGGGGNNSAQKHLQNKFAIASHSKRNKQKKNMKKKNKY